MWHVAIFRKRIGAYMIRSGVFPSKLPKRSPRGDPGKGTKMESESSYQYLIPGSSGPSKKNLAKSLKKSTSVFEKEKISAALFIVFKIKNKEKRHGERSENVIRIDGL